jgi:hypothetical protein
MAHTIRYASLNITISSAELSNVRNELDARLSDGGGWYTLRDIDGDSIELYLSPGVPIAILPWDTRVDLSR